MSALRVAALMSLVVACTASAPQDPPPSGGPAAPTPEGPAPSPDPSPTPAAEPTPTPAAATPEPVTSETRWHCLCYRRTIAGGEEPVTACRSTHDACAALQARAQRGGRGIVARSLMRACQEVRADHPGDLLGERARWTASRVPGAWLSTGECLLLAGSPGEAEPASEVDDEAAGLAAEAAAEAFYASERIGPVGVGMRDREVIAAVGPPTTKGGREFAEYSGSYEERWEWRGEGLSAWMTSDGKRGPQSIQSFAIEAPSELKTQRGVGIGDPADRVRKLYADVKAPHLDPDDGDDFFVAGSEYGGLHFMFEGGKVQMILLGPSAE